MPNGAPAFCASANAAHSKTTKRANAALARLNIVRLATRTAVSAARRDTICVGKNAFPKNVPMAAKPAPRPIRATCAIRGTNCTKERAPPLIAPTASICRAAPAATVRRDAGNVPMRKPVWRVQAANTICREHCAANARGR